MIIRNGKFGKYMGCIECKTNVSLKKEAELAGICPECSKPTKKTFSKRGKLFFGCTAFPECSFMSWDMPTGEKCPVCGKHLVVRGSKIVCSDKTCSYPGKKDPNAKPETKPAPAPENSAAL